MAQTGRRWIEAGIQNAGEGISQDLSVAKMRLVNVSDTEQKVYFKMFRFTEN